MCLRTACIMNGAEKTGCARILKRLPLDDLMLLKDTVTKRLVRAGTAHEAIQAILVYSNSSTELLQRKRILREFIFQYLAEKNVQVSVNAGKYQLIQKALQYWGVAGDTDSSPLQLSGGDAKRKTPSCQTAEACISFGNQSHNTGSGLSMGIQSAVLVTQKTTLPKNEAQADMNRQTIEIHHHLQAVLTHQTIPTQVPVHHQQSHPTPASSATALPTSQNLRATPEHQKLGETFVSWFYKILNSHNPNMNSTPEDFGPHHFWNDVKLLLVMVSPDEEKTDTYEGGVLVSQRFLALVREEQVLFNPNTTSEGIQVKSDPHGLLVVLACGTVHRANDCLGVFQQMFYLIGDPRFNNNWKIKVTKLRMQCAQVASLPRLQDFDNSDLLALVPGSNAFGM